MEITILKNNIIVRCSFFRTKPDTLKNKLSISGLKNRQHEILIVIFKIFP
jgi:hypothetical protein